MLTCAGELERRFTNCAFFYFTGPGVNRHKLYLKNRILGGVSPSPTQILNYPQFSDIPREGRDDEIHRHNANVDVHRETDVAAASHPPS